MWLQGKHYFNYLGIYTITVKQEAEDISKFFWRRHTFENSLFKPEKVNDRKFLFFFFLFLNLSYLLYFIFNFTLEAYLKRKTKVKN